MTFYIGLIGAIILVVGSILSVKKVSHPAKSMKNWLFLIGALFMTLYAILNYLEGGVIFFVIIEIYVNISCILMILNINEKYSTPVLGAVGLVLLGLSIYLFEGPTTAVFVMGMIIIGIGYLLKTSSSKRYLFLSIGSFIVAIFSLLTKTWIFFAMNFLFGIFAGIDSYKLAKKN